MFNGKNHYFDWAIFNSKLLNYQRVGRLKKGTSIPFSQGLFFDEHMNHLEPLWTLRMGFETLKHMQRMIQNADNRGI